MNDFDIVIVGGGLVGLATACSLSQCEMSIAIIDAKKSIYQEALDDSIAIRASAINLASQGYFDEIDVWQKLERSGRILPFNSIDVVEKNGWAKLDADSRQYKYPNLGYIIENQLIQNALYQQAQKKANIHFIHNNVDELFFNADRGFIVLDSGKKIAAKLIIAADGANSSIRQKQQIRVLEHPYRHQSIIATVKTEIAHHSCARQIFYPDGIVAFLPLWQSDMSCLVWSAKPNQASELLTMDDNSFSQALTEISDSCLGICDVMSERLSFPLVARYCPQSVKDRLILIGDAAHTIHPLAGQGVNLGLGDSKRLAEVIKKNYRAGKDFGLKQQYWDYQINRNKETITMLSAMQVIQDMFDGDSIFKRSVRGLGMNMINSVPLIKKTLIKQALGL